MRILTVLILLVLVPSSIRAEEEPPPKGFPATWAGAWKGPCVVIRDGETAVEFPMELHIAPIDGSANWTWRVVYGDGEKRQVRPYELHPVEGKQGHYVIDEKNSILIDSYFENDRLHSRFWVADNVIQAVYTRHGNKLETTLTTYGAKPARMSGGEGRAPPVASYALKAVQRGTLAR